MKKKERIMSTVLAGFIFFAGVSIFWSGSQSPALENTLYRNTSESRYSLAALDSNQTCILQQGVNGYTGVRDTWISDHNWDTPPQHIVNYGQNEIVSLSRDGGDNPMLCFDFINIPPNSRIISATLFLYNQTNSDCGESGRSFIRRVKIYRMLRDWDEGNQINSPINAAGKHGTTGDYAFKYYPGEGIDVSWGKRGLQEGTDYAAESETYAEVINEGWYNWDITNLVSRWVRLEQPNYGLVLRDATGYEDINCDWRNFASSQAVDSGLRPKLVIVYDPDTPLARAGTDQENLSWQGETVILDGSASTDRPVGDQSSLTYTWHITQAAYGSSLSAELYSGFMPTLNFRPDVSGEWDIELVVTNNVGKSAKDLVHLRLLSISTTHPRIYLTSKKLEDLRTRANDLNSRWQAVFEEAQDSDGAMEAKALVSLITNNIVYARQAIAQALELIADHGDWSTKAGDIALIYDWCYSQLTPEQRSVFINYLNNWGDHLMADSEYTPNWGNYWPRHGYSFAMMGLATYGDNPRAREWLIDSYRLRHYRNSDLPMLEYIADGGAWPEGMVYDWIANWPRVKAIEAWHTGTGENLFKSASWYQHRLPYLLLHRWPGIADLWGYKYHPYLSTGDSERNRAPLANYERIMALILIEQFPDDPVARQLQAYLSAQPTGQSLFLFHEEFLWFNPDQLSASPGILTHYASGTGAVFMRSGWPDGAADTDPSATYITFQCGDHFSYHQHFEQNSFTLFKYADLAVDSGVYSGDGLSWHDINYYVRTIAHNTLIVYNPDEDLSHARPDASSNDGGQRSMYPASRSPQSLDYFQQHLPQYETGKMLRFEDSTYYTYSLGDATSAYNNPNYNQAADISMSGNTAKVSRFQRELIYLRPFIPGGSDYLVLFDRVGVTQEAFSGQNTRLLFHTLGEPVVNGTPTIVSNGETIFSGADLATATSGNGRLFIKVLLPVSRNIRKVGGRTVKAFWVFDDNYDWHWGAEDPQPRPINDFEDLPYGEWRLELEPADTALEHNFLTVLYPTSKSTTTMPPMTLINGTGVSGVHIADPSQNRLALFSSAYDGQAPSGAITYSYQPTTEETLHTIFDLFPGEHYTLVSDMKAGVWTVTLLKEAGGAYLTSSQGVLSFTVSDRPMFIQRIPLPAGWNLISFQVNKLYYEGQRPTVFIPAGVEEENPVLDSNSTFKDWFSDNARSLIRDAGDPNKAGDWQRIISFDKQGAHILDKNLPPFINTLKYISAGYGYWIKMNRPGTFVIEGPPAPFTTTLLLQNGWNLIGYIPPDTIYGDVDSNAVCPYKKGVYTEEEGITYCKAAPPVTDMVFSNINGKYRRITSFDQCNGAMIYDTELPEFINTLHYIGAKYGYWVKMSEDAVLVYPSGCLL